MQKPNCNTKIKADGLTPHLPLLIMSIGFSEFETDREDY